MLKLNFKTFGNGPALVILHGLFGSLDNWQTLAKQFAEHFSVFVLDQRNHGKSPHSEDFNYEVLTEDLIDFLDDQGIYRAHILGHSMGGKVAMKLAVEEEERVDKLIIVDMAPVEYRPHHTQILEALTSFPLKKVNQRQEAAALLRNQIPDPAVLNFILKNLIRTKGNGYQWKFNLSSLVTNYEQILKTFSYDHPVDTPTLFIRGENSDYIVDAYQTLIQEIFPNAEFVTVPGAGHWVHAERPSTFTHIVLDYLLDK